jgi:hypothetical protein
MNKQSILLITLILARQAAARCGEGCLSCDLNSMSCDLCDFVSGYHRFDGACIRTLANNCILFGKQGHCVICAEQFYSDPTSGMCLPATGKDTYKNCEIYGPGREVHTVREGLLSF